MVTSGIQVLCSRTETTVQKNIIFWSAFSSNLMGQNKFCCKASTFMFSFPPERCRKAQDLENGRERKEGLTIEMVV